MYRHGSPRIGFRVWGFPFRGWSLVCFGSGGRLSRLIIPITHVMTPAILISAHFFRLLHPPSKGQWRRGHGMILGTITGVCIGNCITWVLPPLSNSWITTLIWLYIALNRTPYIDCYWVGAVPNFITLNPKASGSC